VILELAAVWALRRVVEAADRLDAGLRERLKRLAAAQRLPEGSERFTETEAAAADLGRYAEQNPGAAAQVAAIALRASRPDATPIDRYSLFLGTAFDLISGFRRPVALPGFFNCTNCCVVIDARTVDGGVAHPTLSEGFSNLIRSF
jgi:hypothetical protein